MSQLPCILFEDSDLLVVHKPPGISTHASDPDAPWGIVELLQNRLGQKLGVHQRLDRETSGVMAFAKSPQANRSLSAQFENRQVQKEYLFVTSKKIDRAKFDLDTPIEGKPARTRFHFLKTLNGVHHLWEAHPETGRTHQIRIHAKSGGIPILGDGGNGPLLLHAHRLSFRHPKTETPCTFDAPMPAWFSETSHATRSLLAAENLRRSLLEEDTKLWRWIHRGADGFPDLTLDVLGDYLYLEQFHRDAALDVLVETIRNQRPRLQFKGLIHSRAFSENRRIEKNLIWGEWPNPFLTMENGIQYAFDPMAPGNPGLFLDQRENRCRLQSLASGKRVLNLFAYTCGFSVAAAKGGAKETVSVDLSKNYLERGRANFDANSLAQENHRFLARDARQALRQFAAKEEKFDVIILDPPSSARSKMGGHFSVKRDLKELVRDAARIAASAATLLVSCNLAEWKSSGFLESVRQGVKLGQRRIEEETWIPQSLDFPATTKFPSYFKSVWLRLNEG